MKKWNRLAIASVLVVAFVYAISFFSRTKFNIFLPDFIQRAVGYEGFHVESFLGAVELGNSAGGGFDSDWFEFEYRRGDPFVDGVLQSPLSYRIRHHRHIRLTKAHQYFTVQIPYYILLGLAVGGTIWLRRALQPGIEPAGDGKPNPVLS